MSARASIALWAALAGCADPTLVAGTDEQTIIGGEVDADDGAVVLVLGQGTRGKGWLCSGSVVSPHVVLTAAHCVWDTGTYAVFAGPDMANLDAGNTLAVTAVHPNPSFDASHPENGNDLGVVVLRDAFTAAAPLALNRTALGAAQFGGAVRLVGYGVVDATTGDGAGVRRTVTVKLDGISNVLLSLGDATHGTCSGDSGGPALMSLGGAEVVIGVTSYGSGACTSRSFDTRVDPLVAFVDGYIRAVEPAPVSETGGGAPVGSPPRDESGCAVGGRGDPLAVLLALLTAIRAGRPRRRGAAAGS